MNKILQTLINHGVFMILFVCVSISFIGIACDEQPKTLMSTTQMKSEFEQIFAVQRKYRTNGRQDFARNTALIMISRSIDRLTDTIREHECSPK